MKLPRSEQETIVIFDVEVGKWHIDTTYPTHIRNMQSYWEKLRKKQKID
ncbi:MAG: hypothetical protein LKI50_02450 [Leuconostoc mesenteroides]|jgi:hypothetical protein|nr:hypothetical protein [Leuconostoc mesenteroides]